MSGYFWGPTYEEMLHPSKQPNEFRNKAIDAKKNDPLSPWNLFNINWRHDDDKIRHVVLPKELTGVDAKIVVILGKDFPTGSHKIGATYSCCVEKQVDGLIMPGRDRLIWPSTGNYGVGGAYAGERLGYESLVLLPEEMSQERFDLIEYYGAKYIKTPGCESNVKEIFDKGKELGCELNTVVVNQFSEFANYRFHYYVTGNSVIELFEDLKSKGIGKNLAGFISSMGSAGTIAAGERLKQYNPNSLSIGLEPIQCSTLYDNGFGGHDIQGIGDKHVTFIHNTDEMDAIMCVDEWDSKNGMELIHKEEGHKALMKIGVSQDWCEGAKDLFGISCICNIIGAIKTAKHYKLTKDDVLFTVATDSLERYYSVLENMEKQNGRMNVSVASRRINEIFHGADLEYIREGDRLSKDSWANLKYYTWVEQQGKTVDELRAQRTKEYWLEKQTEIERYNKAIMEKRGT